MEFFSILSILAQIIIVIGAIILFGALFVGESPKTGRKILIIGFGLYALSFILILGGMAH